MMKKISQMNKILTKKMLKMKNQNRRLVLLKH